MDTKRGGQEHNWNSFNLSTVGDGVHRLSINSRGLPPRHDSLLQVIQVQDGSEGILSGISRPEHTAGQRLLVEVHPIQDQFGFSTFARTSIHFRNQNSGLVLEFMNHAFGVLEAASAFHVRNSVSFDLVIGGLLLQDIDELKVAWVTPDGVNDREGEFALGQIFTEAFVLGVCGRGEVEIIVTNLEDEAHQVDQRDTVYPSFLARFGLHQLDRQAKQAAGFVLDHLQVIILVGASQGIPPVQIHPLATMEVQELGGEYFNGFILVGQVLQILEGDEVDVVGAVYSLGSAKDVVSDRDASPQLTTVLDIVDQQRRRM